jgi:quercetin dioxygenase-like cupin family protein
VTFFLLSGELEFLYGDHTFTAAAGDFVHVPKGILPLLQEQGHAPPG